HLHPSLRCWGWARLRRDRQLRGSRRKVRGCRRPLRGNNRRRVRIDRKRRCLRNDRGTRSSAFPCALCSLLTSCGLGGGGGSALPARCRVGVVWPFGTGVAAM